MRPFARNNGSACHAAIARARAGFTLVETLVALAILVVLTAMVATGVPVAFKTYTAAVDGSNAQLLLSTTTTELRDELGVAQGVQLGSDGKVEFYQDGRGYWASLACEQSGGAGPQVIVKRGYLGETPDPSKPATITSGETTSVQTEVLVTPQAGASLNVSYGDITYVDGVFTVTDLKVYGDDSGSPMAELAEYDIKALVLED